MAGKRTGSELNQDNWNDYEPEEAGSFQLAPDEVLKKRVIKVAKRRRPIDETSSSTKNVFQNFNSFATKSTNESPFTFLANLTSSSNNTITTTSTPVNTNGLGSFTSPKPSESTSSILFKPLTTTPSTLPPFKPLETPKKPTENGTTSSEVKSGNSPSKSNDYYANLKGLNESVSQWIKTHVDKNPFCILTPIFKDYEKYLKEIEDSSNKGDTKEKDMGAKSSAVATSHSASIFGQSTVKTSDMNIFGSKPVPSFGTKDEKLESTVKVPEKAEPSKPAFNVPTFSTTSSFGSTTSSFGATGFSFGSGAPFTFANVTKPASDKKDDEKPEEEDDEPPKVEFTPVVEDDHIFTKRCKIFVKKDGNFTDRGVGQLFLKPVSGSEKVQLIVRADTNIGNLLLNFILSESIPMQRMGKNNVMMVCIPMPDSKPPPVPVLLRVKTGEEADELLSILEKHKK